MKKIILAIVAVFAISTSAFAQFNGGMGQQFSPDQIAQMQTDRMAERLGLDDAQKATVLKLTKENFENMRQGRGNFGGQRPTEEQMKEMRKKMEENQAAYKAELKKVLTDEQFAKYEEMEKEQQQMFRRGGMNGGPRGMRGQGGPRQ